MRLFTAIALPDEVAASLLLLQFGVPGARWTTREQLHLTLRFIGEVDGPTANAVDDALTTVVAARFCLALKGVGQFGGKNPAALWAGVESCAELMHLQRKIESALQRAGLPPEPRKYTPHVTLARLKASPRGRVLDYLSDHGLYASARFEVRGFILYSSVTTAGGSVYRAEKAYALSTS